jgi:hypothetical protein
MPSLCARPTAGDLVPFQQVEDAAGKAAMGQVARRDVDGGVDVAEAGTAPKRLLGQRPVEGEIGQLVDQGALFGARDELARRDVAQGRVAPAHQRLDPVHPAAGDGDLRLVVDGQLLLVDGVLELPEQFDVVHHLGVDLRRDDDRGAKLVGEGATGGGVGLLEVEGRRLLEPVEGDRPDIDVPVQLDLAEAERLPGELVQGGIIGLELPGVAVAVDDPELAGVDAIDLGHLREVAHDPFGHLGDDPVHRLEAEGGLDLLGVLQRQQDDDMGAVVRSARPPEVGDRPLHRHPVGQARLLVVGRHPGEVPGVAAHAVAGQAGKGADEGEKEGSVEPVDGVLHLAGQGVDGHVRAEHDPADETGEQAAPDAEHQRGEQDREVRGVGEDVLDAAGGVDQRKDPGEQHGDGDRHGCANRPLVAFDPFVQYPDHRGLPSLVVCRVHPGPRLGPPSERALTPSAAVSMTPGRVSPAAAVPVVFTAAARCPLPAARWRGRGWPPG